MSMPELVRHLTVIENTISEQIMPNARDIARHEFPKDEKMNKEKQ